MWLSGSSETIIIFTAWMILNIFLLPVVEGKGRVEAFGRGPSLSSRSEVRQVSVKDNSKDTEEQDAEEKDENFSFEEDEEVVRVVPEVKTGGNDAAVSLPMKPQIQFPTMDVGVELGFKPQKVKIAYGPEQQGQSQWSQDSALVSNRYEWGQDVNGVDESNVIGMMDVKSMKSIADEVAENILQAADALYFSMTPVDGQPSGWVSQGQHPYQSSQVSGVGGGNQMSGSKRCRSLMLIASVVIRLGM